MSLLVVIDIDATIANASRRIAKAGPEPSRDNREEYTTWVNTINSGMDNDDPVPGMMELSRGLVNGRVKVVYLTSREERHRDVTTRWLNRFYFKEALQGPSLVMRGNNNWQEGADFKEQAIEYIKQAYDASEVVVIDDDEKGTIEEVCHKNGWTFLKARSGGQK